MIILIILGIALMLGSTTSVRKFEPEVAAEGIGEFKISAYFKKGDLFDVYISPGLHWNKYIEPPVEDVPYSHLFLVFNITDPNGNNTWFELAFVPSENLMSLYNVKVYSVGSGLQVENVKEIRCRALVEGNFTAEIWGFIPRWPEDPPSVFQLRKLNIEIERPYQNLLIPGAVLSTLGIVLFVLERRKAQKSKRFRRRKLSKIRSK